MGNDTIEQIRSFKEGHIFTTLNKSVLMDGKLEKVRAYFKKKYDIDYLAFTILKFKEGEKGKKEKYLLCNRPLNASKWHDYDWSTNHTLRLCPALPLLHLLKEGENGVIFFLPVFTSQGTDLRAEFIGEIKDGFSVVLYNEKTNHKIQICMTFTGRKTIASVDKEIFFSLVNDLYKIKDILDPFMNYFTEHGDIEDTPQLQETVNKFTYRSSLSK